jgi:putative component of toxin-antitoxin plasmid stabilization module
MFTVRLTEHFQEWLDGLRDRKAQIRIGSDEQD